MAGESDNNPGNEGGGTEGGNEGQGGGGNNEPIVIPEQSPFTNPGQLTTRTETPPKNPPIPRGDD